MWLHKIYVLFEDSPKHLHRVCSKIIISYKKYYQDPTFQSTRIHPTQVLPMYFSIGHFDGASQDGICGVGMTIRSIVNHIIKIWMGYGCGIILGHKLYPCGDYYLSQYRKEFQEFMCLVIQKFL